MSHGQELEQSGNMETVWVMAVQQYLPFMKFSYVVPWQLFSSPYTMTSTTTPETTLTITTRRICFAVYILSLPI